MKINCKSCYHSCMTEYYLDSYLFVVILYMLLLKITIEMKSNCTYIFLCING